jgi:hypothetical protein
MDLCELPRPALVADPVRLRFIVKGFFLPVFFPTDITDLDHGLSTKALVGKFVRRLRIGL